MKKIKNFFFSLFKNLFFLPFSLVLFSMYLLNSVYRYVKDNYKDFYHISNNNLGYKNPSNYFDKVQISSKPYMINVENDSEQDKTGVLFGKTTYLNSDNFGSSEYVKIKPVPENVTYLQMIMQSAAQPFQTSLIRIRSNKNLKHLGKITNVIKDANGQIIKDPIHIESYLSPLQNTDNNCDIPYSIKIDTNSHLEFKIPGKTKLTFTFFPKSDDYSKQKSLQVVQTHYLWHYFQRKPGVFSFIRSLITMGSWIAAGVYIYFNYFS